ncbi:cytochrome P450 [Streptomyces montanisoli]|uniref:Cytochrome P450 n=1 Tax=Streptomyces montanisoli TaxID=2798581 RepID=A0A940MCG9_9ACTN|nr:cytochrome P450 [Streptomyces montanisoli]MBP0458734.1 cytochrome P450 [Streptomyces montanisoli]
MSFEPADSPLGAAFVSDPLPVLSRMRETCPVTRTTTPSGRVVWVVTREADVRAALRDPRLSLHSVPHPSGRPRRALDRTLVNYDPPDHTRLRRLAAPALSPARLAPLRVRVDALARQALDRLGRPERLELLTDFARPFAFSVLSEVMGVAEDERPGVRRALDVLADSGGRTGRERESALDALDACVRAEADRNPPADGSGGGGAFAEIVRAWRTGPDSTDGAEGTAGMAGADGASVSRDELLDLLAMLLLAGYDSTVQALGMAVLTLVTAPEPAWAALAADPGSVPGALDELLRVDTPGPFATTRRALCDVEIAGTVVPANSAVLLSVAAANHDPRAHEEPHRLRLDRPTRARQLSFGLGAHYCLGSALARMSLAAALGALADRLPRLRLALPPGRLRWGGGHQHRRLLGLPLLTGTARDRTVT